MITSCVNEKVRFIKGLSAKKNREASGAFFVEGLRGVVEGIKSGAELRKLVLSESFMKSEFYAEAKAALDSAKLSLDDVLIDVNDYVFKDISETENPQGIGGIFSIPQPKGLSGDSIILLENLQDPGNMGTIIRTADAAGASGIICTKGCVDVYNQKVIRSTVGSIFHIPVWRLCGKYDVGIDGISELLKEKGYTLYAAHPRGDVSCFDEPFQGKSVIVIGNEANGLSDEMLAQCDKLLTIPMPGKAESLNASVAASLLIYEKVRRK